MKPLVPNTLLQNRYLVVHLIGKGGMGDVYLAVDQRLGSAVALKRTFFADDEMLGNAFEREAKTLARLRHPVLPKVSDHFTENGEQYLVMEHISGEDLSKRLEAANKPFPFSWVLFWADQMLDALSYLHSHEPPIIHRDIKPQNLKLTDENHIILLDFGLSKNNTGESRVISGSSSTGSSIVGYTPHYAPMEQIRGTGTNARSDLYSLSATVYQLLTNLVPADALSRADSMLNDLPDPIKPISDINPEVSKAVSDVILKGMEVSQEKRWSAAREMQKTLRDAYAQMQNQMAAQTMAFNVNDVQAAPEAVPPTQQKTEVINHSAPLDNGFVPPVSDTAPLKTGGNSGSFGSQPPAASEPNFDATLRMDSIPNSQPGNLPPADSGMKQSDVKTEVFLADKMADLIPPTPVPIAQNESFRREENFQPTENYSASGNFNQKADNGDNFAPNSTVPLFNLEQQGGQPSNIEESGFYTNNQAADGGGEEYTDFSATRNFTVGEIASSGELPRNADSSPLPVKSAAPVNKKSSGKILGIIAGLGALLVLALGAAGGGWWYYKNRMAADIESSTPTPSPTVKFTPTPSPEYTPETNVNAVGNLGSETNGSTNSNDNNDNNVNNETGNTNNSIRTPPPTPVTGGTTKPNSVNNKVTQVKPVVPPPVKPPTGNSTPKKETGRPMLPNQ